MSGLKFSSPTFFALATALALAPLTARADEQAPYGNNSKKPVATVYYIGDTAYTDRVTWLNALGPNGDGKIVYPNGETTHYSKGSPDYKTDANGKVIARMPKNADGKQVKADECEKSKAIDPRFVCSPTHGLVKATEVSNQVMTGAGRSVVNQVGAIVAQRAQNGTLSSTQEGAAKLAGTSQTFETALSAANVLVAAKLSAQAKKHSANIAELEANANLQSVDGANENLKGLDYQGALIEQRQAKKAAQEGMYKAAITGVTSGAAAVVARGVKKNAEQAADTARSIEAKLADNAIRFDSTANIDTVGGGNGGNLSQLASEASTDSTLTTNSDGSTGDGTTTPLLGAGSDSGSDDAGPNSPSAGRFKSAENGGGGGGSGGGGGGGAGGGGSSGAPANDDPKAQYATEFGTKERYESGGSPGSAAKAGGKGGGAKDDGIDLNGLLAQFMPKSQDDLGPKNGILDYAGFGGGRVPAQEQSSFLDKNADLFQRIHETMAEKNRKGHVGL